MARASIGKEKHPQAWSKGRASPLTVEFGHHSFSGNEPNSLFVFDGKRYHDLSGVSGLDSQADGRAVAQLDFDRDGRRDLVAISANTPLTQLYHNQVESSGNSIAVRLVGGNRAAAVSREWSNRGAIGTRVWLTPDDQRPILREARCGEGLSSQNSATLLFGIGAAKGATIELRWPSGRKSKTERVRAGSLVTVYENPAEAPAKNGVVIERYRPDKPMVLRRRSALKKLGLSPKAGKRGRVFVMMATWCVSCIKAYPQVRHLRASLGDMAFYGVPVDPSDSPAKLAKYLESHDVPYELLTTLTAEERANLEEIIGRSAPTPSTIVTDSAGRVRGVFPGVPNLSQIYRVLESP